MPSTTPSSAFAPSIALTPEQIAQTNAAYPLLPTDDSEIAKGVASAVDQAQAFVGGAVGLAAQGVMPYLPNVAKPAAESVRDWGLKTYKEQTDEATAGWQAPKVAQLEDIKFSEEGGGERLKNYIAYTGAQGLTNMAINMLGGGGAGGIVGKQVAKGMLSEGLKAAAEGEIKKKILGQVVGEAAQKEVGKALLKGQVYGGIAGSAATTFATESGQAFGGLTTPGPDYERAVQIKQAGPAASLAEQSWFAQHGEQVLKEQAPVSPEKAVGPAALYGLGSTLVEFIPEYTAAKAFGLTKWFKDRIRAEIKNTPELAKAAVELTKKTRAAKVIGKGLAFGAAGAGMEGLEEGTQQLMQSAAERAARDVPIFQSWGQMSEDEKSQFLNSTVAGSIPGAVIGMFGGAGKAWMDTRKKTAPPTVTPETPPPPATPATEQSYEEAAKAAAQAATEAAGLAPAPTATDASGFSGAGSAVGEGAVPQGLTLPNVAMPGTLPGLAPEPPTAEPTAGPTEPPVGPTPSAPWSPTTPVPGQLPQYTPGTPEHQQAFEEWKKQQELLSSQSEPTDTIAPSPLTPSPVTPGAPTIPVTPKLEGETDEQYMERIAKEPLPQQEAPTDVNQPEIQNGLQEEQGQGQTTDQVKQGEPSMAPVVPATAAPTSFQQDAAAVKAAYAADPLLGLKAEDDFNAIHGEGAYDTYVKLPTLGVDDGVTAGYSVQQSNDGMFEVWEDGDTPSMVGFGKTAQEALDNAGLGEPVAVPDQPAAPAANDVKGIDPSVITAVGPEIAHNVEVSEPFPDGWHGNTKVGYINAEGYSVVKHPETFNKIVTGPDGSIITESEYWGDAFDAAIAHKQAQGKLTWDQLDTDLWESPQGAQISKDLYGKFSLSVWRNEAQEWMPIPLTLKDGLSLDSVKAQAEKLLASGFVFETPPVATQSELQLETYGVSGLPHGFDILTTDNGETFKIYNPYEATATNHIEPATFQTLEAAKLAVNAISLYHNGMIVNDEMIMMLDAAIETDGEWTGEVNNLNIAVWKNAQTGYQIHTEDRLKYYVSTPTGVPADNVVPFNSIQEAKEFAKIEAAKSTSTMKADVKPPPAPLLSEWDDSVGLAEYTSNGYTISPVADGSGVLLEAPDETELGIFEFLSKAVKAATEHYNAGQQSNDPNWEPGTTAGGLEKLTHKQTGYVIAKDSKGKFHLFDNTNLSLNSLTPFNTVEEAKAAADADVKLLSTQEGPSQRLSEWNGDYDSGFEMGGYTIIEDPSTYLKIVTAPDGTVISSDKDYYSDAIQVARAHFQANKGALGQTTSAATPTVQPQSPHLTQAPINPSAALVQWAPDELPPGYMVSYNGIQTPAGISLAFDYNVSAQDRIAIAHIHNYIAQSKMSPADKIVAFEGVPKSTAELNVYKQAHPFMLAPVSVSIAGNQQQAEEFLTEILQNQQKYSLAKVMEEMDLFENAYGKDALTAIMEKASKEMKSVVPAKSLSGWLDTIESEEALLKQNPHEGIWAGYKLTGGNKSRYGVVIIDPKIGKVLLRRVANDYEGITWDFARGGADKNPKSGPAIPTGVPGQTIEHPLLAAKREAREEFGVNAKIIGQLAEAFYTGKGEMASLYYVGVQQGPTVAFENETTETRWVTFDEAQKLIMTVSTMPLDPAMKRDGPEYAGKRQARILRTLQAVFNPVQQKSGWNYKGNVAAEKAFFQYGLDTNFPQLAAKLQGKSFGGLSAVQQVELASATWAHFTNPEATPSEKQAKYDSERKRRLANLRIWIKNHAGGGITPAKILSGEASVSSFMPKAGVATNPKVVSLYHAAPTQEGIYGDVLHPLYFGSSLGGDDTKQGMYLATTADKAGQFNSGRVYNFLVAFKNLKVIQWGSSANNLKSFSMYSFTNHIKQAKTEGYDGVMFTYVSDSANGHQFVVWAPKQVITTGLENVGLTGKNLYQSWTGAKAERAFEEQEAQQVIADTFGEDFLQKVKGRVVLSKEDRLDGVAGEYDEKADRLTIFLQNIIDANELIGTVLHEGRHARLDTILGSSLQPFYLELVKLAQDKNPIAVQALKQTAISGARRFNLDNKLTQEEIRSQLEAIDPAFLVQEDFANFIQGAHRAAAPNGLYRKIINTIKAWWATTSLGKMLKKHGVGPRLSDELAVALGVRAIRAVQKERTSVEQDTLTKYYAFAAHLTGANWATSIEYPYGKPSVAYVLKGAGEGYISFGWGFYLLESRHTLAYYKQTLQGAQKTEYGFYVPEGVLPKLIEWDRPLHTQPQDVQTILRDPADGYQLMQFARAARERTTEYPSGPKPDLKGTGGSFYSEVVAYFKRKLEEKHGYHETVYDPETGKSQRIKNLARREASRFLNQFGIKGVHYLDAGSRAIRITKVSNTSFKLKLQSGTPLAKEETVTLQELAVKTSVPLATEANKLAVGEEMRRPGYGHYNWVLWNQPDLDQLQMVYKNKQPIPGVKASSLTHGYNPNAVDHIVAEEEATKNAVINPLTGEWQYTSEVEAKTKSEMGYWSKLGEVVKKSVGRVRKELSNELGSDFVLAAEKTGLLVISPEAGPDGAAGHYNQDTGVVTLYAGSQPAEGNSASVMLHEGSHQTLDVLLRGKLGEYVRDITKQAQKDEKGIAARAVTAATTAKYDWLARKLGITHQLDSLEGEALDQERTRVVKAVEEKLKGREDRADLLSRAREIQREETFAYFVQFAHAEQMKGMGPRLINSIKAAWLMSSMGRAFAKLGLRPTISDGVAVELARRATQASIGLKRDVDRLAKMGLEVNGPAGLLLASMPGEDGVEQLKGQVQKALQAEAPALTQIGAAMEAAREGQAMLYSRPAPTAWSLFHTDPLSSNDEDVFHPGFLNKLGYELVEGIKDLELLAPKIYSKFNRAVSKTSNIQRRVKEEFLEPINAEMKKLAAAIGGNFNVTDLDRARFGQHIIEDHVHERDREINSKWYASQFSELLRVEAHRLKSLNGVLSQEIYAYRKEMDDKIAAIKENKAKLSEHEQRLATLAVYEQYLDGMLGVKAAWKYTPELVEHRTQWERERYFGPGFALDDMLTQTTDAELQAIQAKLKDEVGQDYEKEYDPKGIREAYDRVKNNAHFKAISALLDEMAKQDLALREASGLVSHERAKAYRALYKHYTPLKRIDYAGQDDILKGGRISGTGQKARIGSTELNVPAHAVQNMAAQLMAAANVAMANEARAALAEDYHQAANTYEGWIESVGKDDTFEPGYDSQGFAQEHKVRERDKDIPYYVDGKRYVIKINDKNHRALYLSKAIQNLDPVELGPVMKVFRQVNKWLRNVNIGFSPAFLITNFPRDVGTGLMNAQATELQPHTGELLKELKASFRALKKVYLGKKVDENDPDVKLVREWEALGGRISYTESLRVGDDSWQSFEHRMNRHLGEFTVLGRTMHSKALGETLDFSRSVLDKIEAMNSTMENVMRFSAYKVYVRNFTKAGMSAKERMEVKERGAQLSKDITTNFDRRGLRSQVLGTWFLFAPATIAGNRQVLHNVLYSANKQKLWVAMAGLATFALLNDMLGAAGGDDWDKRKEWEKQRYATLGIEVGGAWAKIPLPWVFNIIWRMGEGMGEILRGKNDPMKLSAELVGMMLNTFNPIGQSGTPIQALAPSAVDPFIQIMENTDGFGRKLGPERMPGQEYLPDSQLVWDNTPKFYKWLSQTINGISGGSPAEKGIVDLRPSTFQVLADTMLGSGGKFFGQALKLPFDAAAGKATIQTTPVARQFLAVPGTGVEAQLYHDRIARIEQAKNAEKTFLAGPARDLGELQRVRQQYAGELRMKQAALDVERQIKDLRVQKRTAEIKGNEGRSSELKARIETQMTRFNRVWGSRVGN